jgi:alkanesulfonate monooxygenase SsuD/methylene tetrahydromethanopterin reductase-like flavin-dependent oxidoreductase (luciferase family)
MKVGIVLNGRRSAEEIAELAQLAEAKGIRQLWLSGGARTKDHFLRLAVAATKTRAIELGPVAISPFEAHPARIAIEVLTLHEMARGRARLVLGGGGDFAATLGVKLTGRVQAVEETIDIIRALARGGEVNYRGRLFQIRGLFSPWTKLDPPRLYVGANRPRMIRMAAGKADGAMFSDMPLGYLASLVEQVRAGLAEAGRPSTDFRISNWFMWNVQDTQAEAIELARRQLGFRLYYVEDVAQSIGLTEDEGRELKRRQPEMLRAIFEGKDAWRPPARLTELLIRELTLSGGLDQLDQCIERLLDFEKAGVDEVALDLHGDPARAIRLLGERVLPVVQKGGQPLTDPDVRPTR